MSSKRSKMASSQVIWLWCLFVCQIVSSAAKDGFILTVPKVLREGSTSEICLTVYAQEPRSINISFISAEEGNTVQRFEDTYLSGVQKCTEFQPPAMGYYQLLLTNQTDILHDLVDVSVSKPGPMTLVQTDKPQYKPGQAVKFRVLTLLPDLKPRIGKIYSIFIRDRNQIRVKQFMNVETNGLVSLEFQLSSEAKLGTWKIDINMDGGQDESPISTTFEVSEYVLPRFEVLVNPPSYILSDTELVEGSVCAKYTYGKKVVGYLDVTICWGYEFSGEGCIHEVVEFEGCHNFTANMTDMMSNMGYHNWGAQLKISASVTELGTGAVVNKTQSGPSITYSPLNIEISDFTNGFFKPLLPYIGKVTVKTPDGSPAVNEEMAIIATDANRKLMFTGKFTTDVDGVFTYSFCEGLTEKTTSIEIEARAIRFDDSHSTSRPRRVPYYGVNRPSAYRQIRQWFSPTYSYIQIPRIEATLSCGQGFSQDIPFTTRNGQKIAFTYQVISKGQLVKTGQVISDSKSNYQTEPSQRQCLQREEITTLPPPTLPTTVEASKMPNEEPSSDEIITEDENDDDVIEKPMRPPPPPNESGEIEEKRTIIPMIPEPPMEKKEPVVRPDVVSDLVSTFHLDFEVTADMSPAFTLLVFHVLDSGEVAADSMTFEVQPCFNNEVEMTFNTTFALPGEHVGLMVGAEPGSVCGVGVVDKSVNILGGKHQVTIDTIFNRLKELSWSGHIMHPYPRRFYHNRDDYCENRMKAFLESESESGEFVELNYWHYSSEYVDALQAFSSSGFIVVTNLDLETRPCERKMPYVYALSARRGGMTGPVPESVENPIPSNARRENVEIGGKSKAPRTEFPETWLWDIIIIDESGTSKVPLTAPHTVTSWVGNAMCVDADHGFGVSPMTSLTTFQPFFISLQLPYSAIRDERLPIILTVYNYLEKCLNIELTLDTGDAFIVSNRRGDAVCVCGGKSMSQRFYITPKAIGSLPITAKAEVVKGTCGNDVDTDTGYEGYSDAVRRNMLVKAEGVTQEYTQSMYMCPKGMEAAMEDVELRLPEDIVKDSAIGQIRVIGDIMGPALTNLDNLVRMPTGCGEQNMVGFVPNIFVLKYLTNTNRLTEEVKSKAMKHMEIGYQRELNYRHKDGSYSAFGERDEQGSVWLTGFVVKSFAQARDFIYIDEEDMELSISFLRRSQLETGCFRETGKVFSSYMMGGLAKGKNKDTQTALTAYVLTALLQAKVNTTEKVIMEAVKCMNNKSKKEKFRMDPYTLSLVVYANTLYDPQSQATADFLKLLNNKAKQDGEYRYWQRETSKPKPTNTWWHYAAPSAEVEMTSYALLAFITYYGDQVVEDHHDIAMWISQQRNPNGGFASTQDTIVGLNALSEFAEKAYNTDPTELEVTISDEGDMSETMQVSEMEKTTLLLQSRPIKSLPNKIHVETSGSGCALVQTHVQYNKMPNKILEGEKPSFYLRIKPNLYVHDIDRCDRRTLDITVGARGNQKFSKGMSLVRLQMVTGWAPIEESFTELKSKFAGLGIKRHEYKEDDGTLTLYFDEIGKKAKKFRVHVEQDQDLKVSAPKPGQVKVVQYYETDVSLTRPYKLKTTCGTKAEIPRRPSFTPPPGVPFQVRVGGPALRSEASVEESRSRNAKCPWCPTRKVESSKIEEIYCNSTAVYKAISGRNGKINTKLRQDFRPAKMTKVNKFAKIELPENCTCPNVKSPKKRVFIFVKKAWKKKHGITIDGSSTVMLANNYHNREIKKLQKKCNVE